MPKREQKTAAELLRELEANPEWVAAREERDRQLQQRDQFFRKDEAALVKEIRSLGYAIDSVWDLVNNSPHPGLKRKFTGPYSEAYPVLVRHLRISHFPLIREGIVRALTVPDLDNISRASLLEEFVREADSGLRWVLANALQVALSAEEFASHPGLAEALEWPGP